MTLNVEPVNDVNVVTTCQGKSKVYNRTCCRARKDLYFAAFLPFLSLRRVQM